MHSRREIERERVCVCDDEDREQSQGQLLANMSQSEIFSVSKGTEQRGGLPSRVVSHHKSGIA